VTTARPTGSVHAERLASREVRDAIARALRGVPKADVDDAVQEVVARALAIDPPPETLEACLALVASIARNLSADQVRTKTHRAKVDARLEANPDAAALPDARPPGARDPLDAKRQLDFVRREVEAGRVPERAVAILQAVAEGADQNEVAKDLGLAHSTVRNEVAKTRAKLRASWAAYLAAATVVVLAVVVWISLREGREDVAHRPTPQERAAEMRKAALADCEDKRWEACLEGLNRARELDRAGDQAPEIVAARGAAVDALTRSNEPPRNLPTLAPGGDN
jgi:RNA polymerase sigma factor (sigma-70 family)